MGKRTYKVCWALAFIGFHVCVAALKPAVTERIQSTGSELTGKSIKMSSRSVQSRVIRVLIVEVHFRVHLQL